MTDPATGRRFRAANAFAESQAPYFERFSLQRRESREKKKRTKKKDVDEPAVLNIIRDPNADGAETLRTCLGP